MAVTVISATSAHAPDVARLLHDFNTEFESPTPSIDTMTERFASLLRRDNVRVFLALGPDPVGFAYLTARPTPYFDGPLVQLEELYVTPELRDQGIGTTLIERSLAWGRNQSAGEMHINVDEVDLDTRRFYERHGFVNIEAGTDYRMLCYTLALGPPNS